MVALAAPQQQDQACTDYTVQAGDTLGSIAGRVYGDAAAYTQIVSATNQQVTTDGPYAEITDPNAIDVGQTLCVPGGEGDIEALLANPPAQSTSDILTDTATITQTAAVTTTQAVTETTAASDQLRLVVSNRSLGNASSTLTLSGGEFEGGQAFNIEAGQSQELILEPGDYRATWTSPASEVDFNQSFSAIAGNVADVWIDPEEERVVGEFTGSPQIQTQSTPAVTSTTSMTMTEAETFAIEEGQSLLLAGNRSLNQFPATLTLSGGEFGGGQAFTIGHGEQIRQSLAPGRYRFTWSSADSDTALNGELEVAAGQIVTSWYSPEEAQAFVQIENEAPVQVR
jgi:LysM repeat protein